MTEETPKSTRRVAWHHDVKPRICLMIGSRPYTNQRTATNALSKRMGQHVAYLLGRLPTSRYHGMRWDVRKKLQAKLAKRARRFAKFYVSKWLKE